MSNPKILILDDHEPLLEKLRLTITKYEVVPATNLDEALKLIQMKDVSFIVADIRLGDSNEGHYIFERLFSSGKLVPGIIITGFVIDQRLNKELLDMGVTEVVEKRGIDLGEVIEQTADRILTNKTLMLAQLTNKVRKFGLWDAPLDGGEKIKDVLNKIFAGNYPHEDEGTWIDLIHQRCNRLNRLDDRDNPFQDLGHTKG